MHKYCLFLVFYCYNFIDIILFIWYNMHKGIYNFIYNPLRIRCNETAETGSSETPLFKGKQAGGKRPMREKDRTVNYYMTDEAKKARREYARQWRLKNPDKVRANLARYWERRAKEKQAAAETVTD